MCFQPLTMTCAGPGAGVRPPACSRSARPLAACARSLSGFRVERGDERSLEDVGLYDDAPFVDDRRAGESPLRGGKHEVARLEHAEILASRAAGPSCPARAGLRTRGTRRCARRRWRGWSSRAWPWCGASRPGRRGAVPAPISARRFSCRGRRPSTLSRSCRRHRRDVAVEPDLQALVAVARRGRDADEIAPDDRAGVAEPGDAVFHFTPVTGRRVPGRGVALAVADAAGGDAAEGGPVHAGARGACGERGRRSGRRRRARRSEPGDVRACARSLGPSAAGS